MKQEKRQQQPSTDERTRVVTVRVPLSVFRLLKDITGDTDESNAEAVSAAIRLYAQTLAAKEGV